MGGCRSGELVDGSLRYDLPSTISVDVGGYVPGTNIQYLGMSDRGAHVLLGDQIAYKKFGDSLDWSGTVVNGTDVELTLRVLHVGDTSLKLVGKSELTITDVVPTAAQITKESDINYGGLVTYSIAQGEAIPGSTVIYEGFDTEGVILSGIEGYPYRKTGDSIAWEGTLRSDVEIALNVRVVYYNENKLYVSGTVNLWLE